MKTCYKYWLACLTLGIVSCEDVINIDLDEGDKKYVIEASIETGEKPQAYISLTQAYDNDNATEPIASAVVTITDLNEQTTLTLDWQESTGLYTSAQSMVGQVGHAYRLDVKIGEESFTATDTIHPMEAIDQIVSEKAGPHDEYSSLKISQQERPGLGDNYMWTVHFEGYPLTHPTYWALADDQLVEGNYVSNLVVFNGEYAANGLDMKIPTGTPVRVKAVSLTRVVYLYFLQIQMLSFGQSMFSPPPANPTTNIKGGALGIFRASDVSWSPQINY